MFDVINLHQPWPLHISAFPEAWVCCWPEPRSSVSHVLWSGCHTPPGISHSQAATKGTSQIFNTVYNMWLKEFQEVNGIQTDVCKKTSLRDKRLAGPCCFAECDYADWGVFNRHANKAWGPNRQFKISICMLTPPCPHSAKQGMDSSMVPIVSTPQTHLSQSLKFHSDNHGTIKLM